MQRSCAGTGSVKVPHHDCVDPWIVLFSAGDVMVKQFQGTELSGSDQFRQRAGGQKCRVHDRAPAVDGQPWHRRPRHSTGLPEPGSDYLRPARTELQSDVIWLTADGSVAAIT